MLSRHLPTLLLAAALLALPLVIWLEHTGPELWQERVVWPSFDTEPNRHTPRFTQGIFLPPTVTDSRTITAAENPVIVAGPTRIEPGVQLALEPGVHVVFHEFAGLEVAGGLTARGTEQRPVHFTSNELHEENRMWTGITTVAGGRVTLDHTLIEDASPAVSCLPASTVTIAGSVFQRGSVGLFRQSPRCTITASTIRGVTTGVVSYLPMPALTGVDIDALRQAVVTIEKNL